MNIIGLKSCGKIVRDEKTGRILKVELKPGFYKLPIDEQYDFLCLSKKDFLERTSRMRNLAIKKLKEVKQ